MNGPTALTPSRSRHYFTAGRSYLVIRREGPNFVVADDRGRERVVSTTGRCPHLLAAVPSLGSSWIEQIASDRYAWEHAGRWHEEETA